MIKIETRYLYFVYYLLLLIVLASRQSTEAPSMVIRLLFMTAVILPTLFSKTISFPAIITIFSTLTVYGFMYSYMPYTHSMYVWVTLVITVFFILLRNRIMGPPLFLWILTIYILFVDIFNGSIIGDGAIFENVFLSFILLICFCAISSFDKKQSIEQISLAFMLITTVLSLYYLINREAFTVYYDYAQQYERIGWIDANYFGTVLGLGMVMALCKLLKNKDLGRNIPNRVFCFVTIAVATPVLLLNASRGAVLSVVAAGAVLLLFSKIKVWYKFLILFVMVVALIYLYNNQYMELLLYRIESDDTGGSGRLAIWSSKLQAFMGSGLLNILFGVGYKRGLTISGPFIGFHNDFIAFLVDYGIIGFIAFVYLLFYPISKTSRSSNYYPQVICLIVYLIFTCLTLEPISGGRLPYYVFYLQALLLAKDSTYKANFISYSEI